MTYLNSPRAQTVLFVFWGICVLALGEGARGVQGVHDMCWLGVVVSGDGGGGGVYM